MINPKQYKKLKEVIQKANPEIMELKFGCRVKCVENELANQYDLTGNGLIISQSITAFDGELRYINTKEQTHRTIDTDFIYYHKDKFKILGRPIRLDDTALIVKNKHYLIDNWKVGYLDDQDEDLIQWLFKNVDN